MCFNQSIFFYKVGKSKITKILNSEENQFGKSIITWQNQITKRIKNEWTRTVIFLTWCLIIFGVNVFQSIIFYKVGFIPPKVKTLVSTLGIILCETKQEQLFQFIHKF